MSSKYLYMQECWSLFSKGGTQKLCQETSLPLLGTIPLDPVSMQMIAEQCHNMLGESKRLTNVSFAMTQELVRCCEGGLNILDEKPDSPAANALLQLANTIRLPP